MSLKKRIKKLNEVSKDSGECILYIMSRDQRVSDNHALIAAQKHAHKIDIPVVVGFALYPLVSNRVFEQYEFMIEGLKEIDSKLSDLNIPFIVEAGKASKIYPKFEKDLNPAAIYFDFSPLRGPREVKMNFAEESEIPCYVVDTHNIVPVWEASNKEEVGARTIRKKIVSRLDEYLIEPEKIAKQSKFKNDELVHRNQSVGGLQTTNDWESMYETIKAERLNGYKPVVEPGEKAAQQTLKDFIVNKLEDYSNLRNDPANNHLSNLSAYFHFGQLSALRVALDIKKLYPRSFTLPGSGYKEGSLADSIESFLEESIIRKELSDNFCFYNENYDSLKGAARWAQKTLEEHKDDEREYTYTFEELEQSKTHDNAWNAAQNQMIKTGKMHGYMRMYWAKKILEWTNTPATALRFAIELNDKYELDGYDPNGYVGCMWSIAGVHDRGWTEREIFGKIRYMNFNGLKRKFDIGKYIERWS